MSNMELRLAGSGGQGVILATVILAEAAILADDVDTLGFLCEQQLLPKRHMDFFVDVSAQQQGHCRALMLPQPKKKGQRLKKRFQL